MNGLHLYASVYLFWSLKFLSEGNIVWGLISTLGISVFVYFAEIKNETRT
jgi:hypothetical protein